MTSEDKTRQKLVDSLRKTKAAAEKKKTPANSGVKKKSSRKKSQTGRVSKANKKAIGQKTGQMASDPYQSGRRIWPD